MYAFLSLPEWKMRFKSRFPDAVEVQGYKLAVFLNTEKEVLMRQASQVVELEVSAIITALATQNHTCMICDYAAAMQVCQHFESSEQ
ncbi:hypothetical protein CGT77_05670 [Vibrio cholerae]|uniref:hypothetical protein n=1 Tax=Vibrio cholerae TaxID=666 RepID=UPI0006E4D2A5|nr:hypothetical protein [Vibrio cholerae]EGR4427963.1 hypothetical protein [Vibrio cholerae]KQA49374.1 hypothetical protein XV77_13065 [Vibrio cholerae]KQA59337.1 hypothetical protein XV80_13335 [Vibrio cholerae]KQA70876.1 hypothetical protein XV83_12125 [Vibrio cholerae]PAS09713.1 hypothetical protein CGT77_05670 [Vibrio cholerae]